MVTMVTLRETCLSCHARELVLRDENKAPGTVSCYTVEVVDDNDRW